MKNIFKILLIITLVFFIKSVDAATSAKVGETVKVYESSACKISSCVSSTNNVDIIFTEDYCSATGIKKGNATISISCKNGTSGSVPFKVVDAVSGNNNASNNNANGNVGTSGGGVASCGKLGVAFSRDLSNIFKVFKIVAPILVVLFSAFDFIKAVTGKVEGEMKKAFTKFVKRLVFAVLLFFLPTILNFFLGLVDPEFSSCITT